MGGILMKLTVLLALIPFIGVIGGASFANRVTPYVLGMPFLLFWTVLWCVLASVIMAIVFKLDPKNKEG
jgi:hypothetical protein